MDYYKIGKVLEWIRQLFCRHEYIFMRFRHYKGGVLNAVEGVHKKGTLVRIGIRCRKCNKIRIIHLYGEEQEER